MSYAKTFSSVVPLIGTAIGLLLSCAEAAAGFECVLPYVNAGGTVHILTPQPQNVDISLAGAALFSRDIDTVWAFQSPWLPPFTPLVDGDWIAFKSAVPVVIYSELTTPRGVVVLCSDSTKLSKSFIGTPKTGIAVVNSNLLASNKAIQLSVLVEGKYLTSISLAPEERKMMFLSELLTGFDSSHMVTIQSSDSGFGLFVNSYENQPITIPVLEN